MLQPLNNRVLIRQHKQMVNSVLDLPEDELERFAYGEVVALPVELEMFLKKGDKVFFQDQCGDRVKYEGEEYLLMRFQDILCVERVC